MSTKLYEAYKLPKMEMNQFFSMVEKIKAEVNDLQLKIYKQSFIARALLIYDFKTIHPDAKVVYEKKSEDYSYRSEEMTGRGIMTSVMELEWRLAKRKDKMNMFYFHVDFMFYRGRIYAIPRTMNSDYTKIFKKHAKAEEYGYWNNTDHPEELTQAQWNAREKEWNKVFGDSNWDASKAKNSLKLSCELDIGLQGWLQHTYDLPKDILENMKNRVDEMARVNISDAHFKSKPEIFSRQDWTSKYMEETSTPEFRAKVAAERDRLSQLLRTDLTAEEVLKQKYVIIEESVKDQKDYLVHIRDY